jgi:ssRNA-specific RNase YbeY (16S rRNA maturation enzyme)
MKIMEHPHQICLDHLQTNLEERHKETIRAWRLFTVHTFHHIMDLTLLERSL